MGAGGHERACKLPCSFNAPSTAWRSGLESPHHTRAHAASGTTNRKRGPGRNRCRASEQGVDATIDPAGRTKGRDAFRRGPSRPGRNRTCNPRFWSALLATPALNRLLILKDLPRSEERQRHWMTPALALILALRNTSRDGWPAR